MLMDKHTDRCTKVINFLSHLVHLVWYHLVKFQIDQQKHLQVRVLKPKCWCSDTQRDGHKYIILLIWCPTTLWKFKSIGKSIYELESRYHNIAGLMHWTDTLTGTNWESIQALVVRLKLFILYALFFQNVVVRGRIVLLINNCTNTMLCLGILAYT